jgi:hypothetical protein
MKKDVKNLIFLLIFVVFLIALHQFWLYGSWFELEDIHHETFIVRAFCIILGLIVGDRMSSKH